MPAIPGEGRALHAAAGAQGIPATIARHRRSPYLPGVRSRLWRLVATTAERGDPIAGQGSATGADAGDVAGLAESAEPVAPTAPILALIQRLPLESD